MIVFPQTQPGPKGTSLEREIQSGERQVVDHHAPPCPRSVSDRPSRYPSRTHSVTRDRNDFPVSSAAAREARLDGSSKKSGRAGNSDTSICACTRPATLRDKTRRATGSASVTPNRSPASSLEISPVFVRRSVAADDNESLLLRMAGLLFGSGLIRKLGPVGRVVIWPLVLTGHRAAGSDFNGRAVFQRYRALAACPPAYIRAMRANRLGKSCLATPLLG
ncbi:Uncharacterised protein [Bordetella avium]|nr:Uncharacterised protein [Bordetella avium]